ncbi:MAG: ABC transporter permease [Lachnospiraceae bacterium]|nr:ABC transporter permease [Lachnospiraceae bacterium]
MRFSDMLSMSLSNLFKRKFRTIMTIMGVVIGTASIVVMMSLGIGLQMQMLESAQKWGSLTEITVTAGGNNNNANQDVDTLLSDATVEKLKKIEHVLDADRVLETSVVLKQGPYEAEERLRGITQNAFSNLRTETSYGRYPNKKDHVELYYGNSVLTGFTNPKSPNNSYWSTGVVPDVDLTQAVFVIYDVDSYRASKNESSNKGVNEQSQDDSGGDKSNKKAAKKYLTETAGIMAGDVEDYSKNSWSIYTDVDALIAQLRSVYGRKKAIPGQPTRKNGKPYPDFYYSEITVSVDDIENMNAVTEEIKSLGYTAQSDTEWIESELEQSRRIQAMLGGIGAISLLVAAIGIANTMMMSIYERTKEIGVYKVLGCALKNIRSLFLFEAAFIGMIGGIFGVILSYFLSFLANRFLTDMFSGGYSDSAGGISYIPPWLSLMAIAFATVIGILSGFLPAVRAMKLSPLAAMRNE